MGTRVHANNYTSTLNGSITDVATSAVVTTATGLPTLSGSDFYYLTLVNGLTVEIVKVTARTGTTLTIVRAQESTSGVAWASGSIISLRATANSVDRKEDLISTQSLSAVTVATDDKVLIQDTSNSNTLSTVTAQSIADLVGTGPSFTTKVTIGGNATAAGYLELLEDTDNGSNKITVKPPQDIASDKIVTLQDVTGTVYVSSGTDVAVADGGTGVSTVTTAPTASSFAGWDASANLSADAFIPGYATTATAAGTTTLTVDSVQQQFFTGSTTQTCVMPVTSTLVLGQYWTIVNNSSGVVTVNSSGGNAIVAMAASTKTVVTCILTSGTSAASWDYAAGALFTVISDTTPTLGGNLNVNDKLITGASTTGIQLDVGASGSSTAPIKLTSYAGTQIIDRNTSQSGKLRIYQASGTGSNYTQLTVNTALAGSDSYVLPVAMPAINSYALTCTTAGVMSWTSVYRAGGTDVSVDDGGTGRSVTVAYAPIVGGTSTTSAMQSVLVGSAGQVLQSGGSGAIPVYSTATYPATAGTTRKILVSDGTNIVSSTETYAVPSTAGKMMQSDGTNWTSVTPVVAATASSWSAWDANKNFSSNSTIDGYTTTATVAGTTTLVVGSTNQQYFTGSTTQTVVLPVTSTLVLGQTFRIVNNSTGTVTVQSSGANAIVAMIANTEAVLTCILVTGTTAASWDYQIQTTNLVGTGTGQVVRATSPTLVTPALGTVASGVISACTSTSMALVTPLLGTPTSGVLTNCTGSPTFSQITFSSTSGIIGTTTNDSAAAGSVGQIINNAGFNVSMTTATNANVTSISLTAGDWDVYFAVGSYPAGTTVQSGFIAAINTTSATLPSLTSPSTAANMTLQYTQPAGTASVFMVGPCSLQLASTTTVYGIAQSTFTVSTLTCNGVLWARRRR